MKIKIRFFKISFSVWLALLLLISACSSKTYIGLRNSFADESGIQISESFYGQDPLQNVTSYVNTDVQIDPAKAIVFIHGGGWQTGDKGIWHKHCLDLARTFNCGIYNINYRLGSIENAVTDCVNYIKQLKQTHKKIIVVGFSAGAHISLYLAEKSLVDGAVSFAAPTDLTGRDSTPILDSCLKKGKLKKGDAEKYSPLYLSRDSGSKVPIYLIHSTGDSLVQFRQALNYYASKKDKTDITLKKAKGEHGFQFFMKSRQSREIWEKGVKPFITKIFNENQSPEAGSV